jgi:hypothetical protein
LLNVYILEKKSFIFYAGESLTLNTKTTQISLKILRSLCFVLPCPS